MDGNDDACEKHKKLIIPAAKPDLKVPSLEQITDSLKRANKYKSVYLVLLWSGLRLNEAVHLINNIDMLECVDKKYFKRCNIGLQRGRKQAFWAYLLELPRKQEITDRQVTSYAEKNNLVMPKYIRKFVATKMAELDIPPHIIDFIQGRAAKNVLMQHYAQLVGQADKWYPKYARWLQNQGLLLENSNG